MRTCLHVCASEYLRITYPDDELDPDEEDGTDVKACVDLVQLGQSCFIAFVFLRL